LRQSRSAKSTPPTSPTSETEEPVAGSKSTNVASRSAANCLVTTKPIDSSHPFCLEFSFYPAATGPTKKPSASLNGENAITTWTLSLESKAKMDELINAVRQLQATKANCIDRYTAFKAVSREVTVDNWKRVRDGDDPKPKVLPRSQGMNPQSAGTRKQSVYSYSTNSELSNRPWQACPRRLPHE
jgi:hypothetical protein